MNGYQNDFSLNNNGYPYGIVPPTRYNTFATLSLIAGILSIVFMCCCTYLGVLLGVPAIVFACLDRTKNGTMGGLAIAGLVCGIVGTVLSIALIVFALVIEANGGTEVYLQRLEEMLESMEENYPS